MVKFRLTLVNCKNLHKVDRKHTGTTTIIDNACRHDDCMSLDAHAHESRSSTVYFTLLNGTETMDKFPLSFTRVNETGGLWIDYYQARFIHSFGLGILSATTVLLMHTVGVVALVNQTFFYYSIWRRLNRFFLKHLQF